MELNRRKAHDCNRCDKHGCSMNPQFDANAWPVFSCRYPRSRWLRRRYRIVLWWTALNRG